VRSLLPAAAIAIGSTFGLAEWVGGGEAALAFATVLAACSVAAAIRARGIPGKAPRPA
jgi:hypothetical protein